MDEALKGIIAAGSGLLALFIVIVILIVLLCNRRCERIRRRNALKDFAKLTNENSTGNLSKASSFKDTIKGHHSQIQGYRPKMIGQAANTLSHEQLVTRDSSLAEQVERREEDVTQSIIHKTAYDNPGVSIIDVNQTGSSNYYDYGNGFVVRQYDSRRSFNSSGSEQFGGHYVYGHHVPSQVRQGWIAVRPSHHSNSKEYQTSSEHVINQTESANVVNGEKVVRGHIIKQTVDYGQDGKLEVTGQRKAGELVQGHRVVDEDKPELVQGHFSKTLEVQHGQSHTETSVREEKDNLGHLIMTEERHIQDWPSASENVVTVRAPSPRSRHSSFSSDSNDGKDVTSAGLSGFGAVVTTAAFGEVSAVREDEQHHVEFLSDQENYKVIKRPRSPHVEIPQWFVSKEQVEDSSRNVNSFNAVINTEEVTSSSSVKRVHQVVASTTSHVTGYGNEENYRGDGFQAIIGKIQDDTQNRTFANAEFEQDKRSLGYAEHVHSHLHPDGTASIEIDSETEMQPETADLAKRFGVIDTVVRDPIQFAGTTTSRYSGVFDERANHKPVSASILVGSATETDAEAAERANRFGIVNTVMRGPIEFEETSVSRFSGAYGSKSKDGAEYVTTYTSTGEPFGVVSSGSAMFKSGASHPFSSSAESFVIEDFVDPGPSTSKVITHAQHVSGGIETTRTTTRTVEFSTSGNSVEDTHL